MRRFLFILVVALIGCESKDISDRSEFFSVDPLEAKAAQKLRVFCQSCHGVQNLRFIYSDDDGDLWNTLRTQHAPNSKKLWVEAIYEVLDWPSDAPPPFTDKISPNKDWMPKGNKRLKLASDSVDGEPTRRLILRALKNNLPAR